MTEGAGRPLYVSRGAKDLRAWLDRNGLSVPVFCSKHELNRIEIQRILNGYRQRVPVDVAYDICTAVGGEIAIDRFAHTPAVRRLLVERRSAAKKRSKKRAA